MIYSRITLETPLIAAGPTLIPGITVKPKCPISVADVQRIVSCYFDLPLAEMKSARRNREVARPRQIAMYLCKAFTPASLPSIGRRFGGRDHTTVIHALRRIRELIAVDKEVSADVRACRRAIEKLL